MLGMVFTEFVEMVEDAFSPEMADDLLVSANFEHGGAYTAVGYYDFAEMVTLVTLLSERTKLPVPDLLQTFGQHLFHRLALTHASMLQNQTDLLALLSHLDDHIHPEVQKLYADAKLPSFNVISHEQKTLKMEYMSERHLEDLAVGLITGAAEHFKKPVDIQVDKIDDNRSQFTVTLQD